MWMWMAMIMNGAVLTIVVVGVYLISLINYCHLGLALVSQVIVIEGPYLAW